MKCWCCEGTGIDPVWQLYKDAEIIFHHPECLYCGGSGEQEFKYLFYWKGTYWWRKCMTFPLYRIKKYITRRVTCLMMAVRQKITHK